MKKGVFLLSKAEEFELEKITTSYYDYEKQINFTINNGIENPTVLIESSGPTHSKTMQWPSDDDPDNDSCY